MATNNRCDLPKVRLKFKTTASDIKNDYIEVPRLSKYDATPSVFPERLKMGKEMHEAFMRYRKLKKNNYIRQMANQRKNVSVTQCKKIEGLNTKNKNTTFHNKLQIALECSFTKGFHDNDNEQFRRNRLSSIKSKNKQSKQMLCNNNDHFIIKPHTVSLKSKKVNGHNLNLSDSPIDDPQSLLGLEGIRCQYQTQDERKQRMLKLLGKTKKKLKVTQGSSSFLIQAWKQEKIYRGASYYLKSHSDTYQF